MKKQHRINRRTFLGNSAKIAAAGIIFNQLNAITNKNNSWDGEIKVALVGCGGRGTGAAIQAIAAEQDVRLVARGQSNLTNANASGMGNSRGGNDKGTKTCPDGYAITGVRGKHKTYPCETQWVCSKLSSSP